MTRNALIGQPFTNLQDVQAILTPATVDSLYQLARDRTARTSNYSVTATRPVGQRYQFSATISSTQIGGTPASVGVPEEPGTGHDLDYQAQLYGSNIFKSGDFFVYSAAHATDESGKSNSIGITSRFPIGGAWRVGPRLSVDRRNLSADGSTETDFLPSLLFDYLKGRDLVQIELGEQIGNRDATLQSQKSKHFYASVGYRIGF